MPISSLLFRVMGRQIGQFCSRLAHLLQEAHLQASATSQPAQVAAALGSCRGLCSCAEASSGGPSTSGRQGQISAAGVSLLGLRQGQGQQPVESLLPTAAVSKTFTWWQQRAFSAAQQNPLQGGSTSSSSSSSSNSSSGKGKSSTARGSSSGSASTSQPPPPYWLPPRPNPSKTFKRPQEVVDLSSPALKHYRRNRQSQRMIIYRITKRRSLYMLLDLLKLYQSRITLPIIAATFSTIASVQRHPESYDESQAQAIASFLGPFLAFQTLYADLRSASALLWAWAKLGGPVRDVLGTEMAIQLLARVAAKPDPTDPAILKKLPSEALMGRTPPRMLALLAWSASRVIPRQAAQADARVQAAVANIVKHTVNNLGQQTPQGLAMLATGVAGLSGGEPGQRLLRAAAEEAVHRLGAPLAKPFKPVELCRLLDACSQATPAPVSLFERAAAATLGRLKHWDPRFVAYLAASYAQAGVRHEGLMRAAAETALAHAASQPSVAAGVAAACQKLRCPHPQLQQVVDGMSTTAQQKAGDSS